MIEIYFLIAGSLAVFGFILLMCLWEIANELKHIREVMEYENK